MIPILPFTMETPNSDPTIAVAPPPSRRLPPPCWSPEETVALIDAYRHKWYSLRRGNLRATHWQEVADAVAALSLSHPPKTSIQCRHKMEKLRKRYRAEIQRIGNIPVPNGKRFPSSWAHFKIMDDMELGLSSLDQNIQDRNDDELLEDELLLYPKGIKQAIPLLPVNPSYNRSYHGSNHGSVSVSDGSNGNGVRIKIPNSGGNVNVKPNMNTKRVYDIDNVFDDLPPNMRKEGNEGVGMRMKRKGEGYVRMERMKMEMARELEAMRMKMEMKKTEMILESQQKLLDSFSRSKKVKRMPTPES